MSTQVLERTAPSGIVERKCNGPCGQWKDIVLFTSARGCSRGKAGTCRECRQAYKNDWQRRRLAATRKAALQEALRRVEHIPDAREALRQMMKETG